MQTFIAQLSALVVSPALNLVPTMREVSEYFSDPKNHHHDAKRRQKGEDAADAWAAFVSDIKSRGVCEPLKVVYSRNRTWEIVDGRHRFLAATEAGLTEVPCQQVGRQAINAIMAGSIIGRRHLTKTARAWLAVSLNPSVTDLKAGNPSFAQLSEKNNSETQSSLASKFGVSQSLLSQVCDLYRKYKPSPTLFPQVEWMVWGGTSAGGIEAGLGFLSAAGEDPSKLTKASSWGTALKAGAGLVKRLGEFTTWSPADRQLFQDHLAQEFGKLPEAGLVALREALDAAPAALEAKLDEEIKIVPKVPKPAPPKTAEVLYTCPCCQTSGFLLKGLKAHRCSAKDNKPLSRGDILAAMPSEDSAA